MKTITCKELGGTCNEKLSAETWDGIGKAMTKYVMEQHPDVAKAMEAMDKEDSKRWGREMKPKWEAAPQA